MIDTTEQVEVKEDEIIELSDELLHEVAGGAGNAAIDF